MRLSGLRLPKHAYALLLVPVLACAFIAPAGAEPNPNAASTQTEGNSPAAEAKPAEAAKQSEANPSAAEPNTTPEPGDSATTAKPSATPEADTSATTTDPNAKPETDKSATAAKPAKAGSQILVNIDKSLQEMTVFVDGIEKYQWPVSTGLRGYSTPSGSYTASSMNKIWYSKQWDNAPMPHAVFFTKEGHAIHGSYETKKLGHAASHGCVRLAPKNAQALFNLVEENGLQNTKVVLAGVTPGGEAKVASQPGNRRYRDADAAPWMPPGQGYPRDLFGWQRGPAWGPGYAPPPRYREQRRGWFQRPRGYY
jgi:lipoprotein-anchoring transpeptidase ErfK/SrfK